jgi:hypothetical protein
VEVIVEGEDGGGGGSGGSGDNTSPEALKR